MLPVGEKQKNLEHKQFYIVANAYSEHIIQDTLAVNVLVPLLGEFFAI